MEVTTQDAYQHRETLMTNVVKWLYADERIRNSGTCWELWGGHITADHVYVGANRSIPHFAKGPVMRTGGLLDVCMFGCTLPDEQPRKPIEGEAVTVSGFPAGAGTLEHRYAEVYMARPEGHSGSTDYAIPGWIGKIDQPRVPFPFDSTLFDAVYGGMSGGLVSATDGEPLGVLITQNGRAHLDRDEYIDDSFDFVPLYKVWEVMKDAPLVA